MEGKPAAGARRLLDDLDERLDAQTSPKVERLRPNAGDRVQIARRFDRLQIVEAELMPGRDTETAVGRMIGARLDTSEPLASGRVGRGERWQFSELASETCLYSNNVLVYLDRFRLTKGFEGSPWAMGDCAHVGTGLYVGPDAQHFASVLHQSMPKAGIDTPAPNLAVIRVVSVSGPDFHLCREMFIANAPE